ncbi:type II toxin-antitoxin system prevent-host-death family antitoxin (plasmid) [Sinorhizobium sp. B11]
MVQRARFEGPQEITVRGERTAVVLSTRDYDAMRAGRPTLVDDLLGVRSWDDELVDAVEARAKIPSRDVAF